MSWYLAGVFRLWPYMYSMTKCKHIYLYPSDIAKKKKIWNWTILPRLWGKSAHPVPFAPNGLFHCNNALKAVLWLIGLTNLRLAQIIAPVDNNDSTESKHSWHFGQWIKTLKIFLIDYSSLFSLKHAMLSSMSTNSSDFQVTGCCPVTFVWCYSMSEMRKCLNSDLRRTAIFPQCETLWSNAMWHHNKLCLFWIRQWFVTWFTISNRIWWQCNYLPWSTMQTLVWTPRRE